MKQKEEPMCVTHSHHGQVIDQTWKYVMDYGTRYKVSDCGFVESTDRKDSLGRKIKGKWLKARVNRGGYEYVSLSKNGKQRIVKVHRLVAEHFIPNPKGLPCVNHKDGNKFNNRITNLEWCTHKENTQHAWGIGLCEKTRAAAKQRGIRDEGESLKQYVERKKRKVRCIETDEVFSSVTEAAKQKKLDASHICKEIRGKIRHCGGFHWEYVE